MPYLTILVVDDDPVVRRLVQKRLLDADYTVSVATDGIEAKRLMTENSYDVIITDLIMPGGIDGIDLLELARESYANTEVILITGHAAVEKAVEAMKKGAADYLQKPINFDELFLRLDKIREVKSLIKNAGDIREAMDITEASAASTIQNLEITVAQLQAKLENIKTLLCENDADSQDTLLRINAILHEQPCA